jgi:hypothetical protein
MEKNKREKKLKNFFSKTFKKNGFKNFFEFFVKYDKNSFFHRFVNFYPFLTLIPSKCQEFVEFSKPCQKNEKFVCFQPKCSKFDFGLFLDFPLENASEFGIINHWFLKILKSSEKSRILASKTDKNSLLYLKKDGGSAKKCLDISENCPGRTRRSARFQKRTV